jgi:hypothetical protein
MSVAIIRVVVNNSPDDNADISWLYFWSFIEMGTGIFPAPPSHSQHWLFSLTAIIIACVASFRQLFVTSQNQHLFGQSSSNVTPRRGLLYFLRSASKTKFSSKSDSRNQSNWGGRPSSDGVSSKRSETNILPLDSVHVQSTFEVTSMTTKEQKVPTQDYNIV